MVGLLFTYFVIKWFVHIQKTLKQKLFSHIFYPYKRDIYLILMLWKLNLSDSWLPSYRIWYLNTVVWYQVFFPLLRNSKAFTKCNIFENVIHLFSNTLGYPLFYILSSYSLLSLLLQLLQLHKKEWGWIMGPVTSKSWRQCKHSGGKSFKRNYILFGHSETLY